MKKPKTELDKLEDEWIKIASKAFELKNTYSDMRTKEFKAVKPEIDELNKQGLAVCKKINKLNPKLWECYDTTYEDQIDDFENY
jgi:hypothetical protein